MGQMTIADEDMLDDMEDGNGQILPQKDRIGYWYTYADKISPMATISPADGAEFVMEDCGFDGKGKCAHVKGMGFKEYSGFGFDLSNPGVATKQPYDLSAYKGIAFWAKSSVAFKVSVALTGVVSVAEGGTCVEPAVSNPKEDCFATHGVAILRPGTEWKQHVIPFAWHLARR